MTPATTEARELAAKAVREAEHLAHEAARRKAVATEAVEDGVRATKRAITHGLHDLDDLRDAANAHSSARSGTRLPVSDARRVSSALVVSRLAGVAVPVTRPRTIV